MPRCSKQPSRSSCARTAIRVLEYALLAISATSLCLSLALVADGFRDVIAQNMGMGLGPIIARAHLRSETYRFFAQIAFLFVAVSFVSTPVPNPLPAGTVERVAMFVVASAVVLVASGDAYLAKRRLLRSA